MYEIDPDDARHDGASVTPFDRRAYDRFSLPRSMASAMVGLDDPDAVAATDAAHMRDDDLVIGVALPDETRSRSAARAYPIWIVDHYHVVNDKLGGRRIVVTSCERCQTGSAFEAEPPGPGDRKPLFRAGGVFCATLMMTDLRSGSLWNHYDGRPVRGRAATAGARLPWLPTLVTEWDEWLHLHPDSEVLTPPQDPRHPDARHGHGREEVFCRPGIDPAFLPTIVGPLDLRFPEHELVLGVDDDPPAAYPLHDVQREGGVVRDGDRLVLAGPAPAGTAMRAFQVPDSTGPIVRDEDGTFVEKGTDARWTIEGLAIEGGSGNATLEPVRSYSLRWHAWVYARRHTSLFRSDRPTPCLEDAQRSGARHLGGLDEVLDGFAAAGVRVEVGGPLTRQLRPRRTIASLVVRLDGVPVLLHRFSAGSAARDLEALDGAWACDPFITRLLPRRSVRAGAVVGQADPWPRFADPAQLVSIPESELPWPAALDRIADVVPAQMSDVPDDGPAFIDVIRTLRVRGHEVLDPGFLPLAQLPPRCVDAIGVTVEGDRFLWYRFGSIEAAGTFAGQVPTGHAVAAGLFVVRSTPDTMYRHQAYEIDFADDITIRWSPLLGDERFMAALRAACVPSPPDPDEEETS